MTLLRCKACRKYLTGPAINTQIYSPSKLDESQSWFWHVECYEEAVKLGLDYKLQQISTDVFVCH